MNRAYDEIMQLIGAEEFKALIQKWEALSNNVGDNARALPRLLPNLLWVGNSGIGRTKLMTLMSAYLWSKGNLVDFYGDVKYLEFLLSYTPREQPFQELQRLEDELVEASGFRSEFRGAILIDITAWLRHYREPYFVSFMEYLSAHSDKWLIVLSVPEMPKDALNNLEAFLSMFLRLDQIALTLPTAEEFCKFVGQTLEGYGLGFAPEARALLLKSVTELRENTYFDGFKTIEMLCQDIAYEHFSSDRADQKLLTEADMETFAPGGNYVKKVIHNSEKIRRIGFGREEE